ncbi:aspartate-tRNA ligase [Aspergillus heteromorphus CBS 117.55]|uniref:aspartate--tRNA ligase n=1 Tax=Aspergillus heteromorphus CBS 117.55 TaxID=1448321 RepID=A0A317WKP6_9EURO|nr:aspartate-tRNA ligase [Aspergillus heteromorphus CBS 117.55]PWY86281.1 aspartate-tRNA ligase [Aspergillus heteromorphus CBS 117.55]
MPSSDINTVVMVENLANPGLYALKGEKVGFDARVNSVWKSEFPGQLSLELRVQETFLTANIDSEAIGEEAWEKAQKLTPESIVRVTGHVHLLSDKSKSNGDNSYANDHVNGHKNAVSGTAYAVRVTELTVVAQASPNLPSCHRDDLSALGLEGRLNNRILDVRSAASGAIFKLHSGMCQLIVEFLCSNGFHWTHTPRIISATIAGDNEYFHLPYFGRDAWLAQSSQHHKQMALSMDMERVFEIGPVFRAEVKSRTSARHMTEFTVLDIGMVFRDDYHEVVELIESMLVFVFRGLQERKQYRHLTEIVQTFYPSARPFQIGLDEHGKIPRVTFLEAKRILREELGIETEDTKNFTDEEEAALGRYFRASPHLGQTDVFTIDQYPASMRQFNSQENPDAPGLSNTWDTIVGGREICSGSQRINGYDELCEAMRAGVCGPPLDPEAEKWQSYLTAFRAGMPPHGGCGLGVNRLLQGFLGLDDVREVTLFPRDVNQLAP